MGHGFRVSFILDVVVVYSTFNGISSCDVLCELYTMGLAQELPSVLNSSMAAAAEL